MSDKNTYIKMFRGTRCGTRFGSENKIIGG